MIYLFFYETFSKLGGKRKYPTEEDADFGKEEEGKGNDHGKEVITINNEGTRSAKEQKLQSTEGILGFVFIFCV